MNRRGLAVVVFAFFALVTFASGRARAITGRECVDASIAGQDLRDRGQLRAAIAAFGKCSDSACPEALRRECFKWVEQTESRTPSVAVAVRDASGADVVAASLVIDDVPLSGRLDGKSRPMDPGVHRLVVVADGYRRFERTFLLREGEQRLIDVTVTKEHEAPPPAPPESSRSGTSTRAVLVPVLGALSLAGIASGAYFWSASVSEFDALERRCAPACTDDDVGPLRTKMTIAHVSFAVAVVAAGAATWLWLTNRASGSKSQAARDLVRGFEVSF